MIHHETSNWPGSSPCLRRARERVMVVVPALTEDEHCDEPVVARLVPRAEVPPAEHVTDRVDAERGVLVEEDPDQAAPHEPAEAGRERPADRVADQKRQPEREHDPEQVEAVDRAHEPVVVEVLAVVASLLHAEVREQPADMRVDEAADGGPGAFPVADVRRVRVARLVGERVMLAVVGHPLRQRPLHRHAAEDRQHRFDRLARLEAAVGEVTVEADRRPKGADDVKADEQREIDPVEGDAPEQAHRREDPERRHDDGDQRHDLADPARPRPHGPDRRRPEHRLCPRVVRSSGRGRVAAHPLFAGGRTTVAMEISRG